MRPNSLNRMSLRWMRQASRAFLQTIGLVVILGATPFDVINGTNKAFASAADRCVSALSTTSNPSKPSHQGPEYGYESEYLFAETGPILLDYKPSKVDANTWLTTMNDEARINYVKEKYADSPEYALVTDLELIDSKAAPIFMPRKLTLDPTGNIEIILDKMDAYTEWETAVDYIVNRYQAGSQQTMVSVPRELFFKGQNSVEANLGWLNFQNEKDTLSKLVRGYEKFKADSSQMVARSFAHPFLGPMTMAKQNRLITYLIENKEGRKYDDESKRFVKTDASFKFIGGVAYRPDIASPERAAFEIRQAHKSIKELKSLAIKVTQGLLNDRSQFLPFAKAKAFDSQKAFDSLDPLTKDVLKELFPSRADPRFQYEAEEYLANEVYRNFAYPIRDWQPLVRALEKPALAVSIGRALVIYRAKLHDIAANFRSGLLTKSQAQAQIQGALAEFAGNSEILPAMEAFEGNKEKQNDEISLDRGVNKKSA